MEKPKPYRNNSFKRKSKRLAHPDNYREVQSIPTDKSGGSLVRTFIFTNEMSNLVSPTKLTSPRRGFFVSFMYYFYIIYSSDLDKYYTGFSSNPEERIRKHNTDHRGYTGKTNDWKLVYKEQYSSKKDAVKRERQVKKWKSRSRIETIVLKGNQSD